MSDIKKYFVKKCYVYTLEGTFEAECPEDAEILFDKEPTEYLTENYLGVLSGIDQFLVDDEIRELD